MANTNNAFTDQKALSDVQAIIRWKAVDRARMRYEKRIAALTMNALNDQIAPVYAAIEAGFSSPENVVTERPIHALFSAIYSQVGVAFARSTYLDLLNNPPKAAHVDMLYKDRATNNQQANELEGNWLRLMRRIAETETAQKIRGITQTTRDIIRNVLGEAVGEGLSIPNTVKRLREKWTELSKKRAIVIARSETVSSSNAGSLLGAQSTGLSLQKSWLATRDSRVRSSHLSVDGQTVDMEEPFHVNGHTLQYPGDSRTAPPALTVQCRCTLTYKRKQ